jgi:hypothetical protein
MIQNVLILGAGSAGLITAISIKRKIPGLRCCSQAILDRDAAEEFQSLHYKFNGMLDTSFWQHARADADVSRVEELLEFYEENGPTGFWRYRLPRMETFRRISGDVGRKQGSLPEAASGHASRVGDLGEKEASLHRGGSQGNPQRGSPPAT